ncbi:MAG: ubiquinone/menaquinone biosynthesis methyltransferase [Armatimonadetes bacterium]|nr:ubiquinone/menaquinone biosynthesis methyltransferase [Armatimonadota bacterium]
MSKAVQRMFGQIPATYELTNTAMTLGLDRTWRRAAARIAVAHGGSSWLDVCCGTGDMTLELRRQGGNGPVIIGADFALPMLQRGRQRAAGPGTAFVAADATRLPFAKDQFDLVTVSFASRNLNTGREAFRAAWSEMARVLKPGGALVIVETSQPPNRFVRWAYHTFVRLTVPALGRLISGSREAYAYLAHTIPRFLGADEFAAVLGDCGFSDVTFHRMTFGAVAVLVAVK